MFLSRLSGFRRRWEQLAMRLSWRHLPPLSTHALAFLIGTLCLRSTPPQAKAWPQQILVPADRWLKEPRARAEGAHRKGETRLLKGEAAFYVLARRLPPPEKGFCRHEDTGLRLWQPPGAKSPPYLLIPGGRQQLPILAQLLTDEALQLVSRETSLAPCPPASRVDYE